MIDKIRLRRAIDNEEKDFHINDVKAMEEWSKGSDCYRTKGTFVDQQEKYMIKMLDLPSQCRHNEFERW